MAGFGAFGKMPSLGDFFRLSLPAGFEAPWDCWLQDGLLAARASLGDRWQDCFFSAPIWRFTLAPGLAGPAVQGVLMPSVDRVGRQFPLTLVGSLDATRVGDVAAAHLAAATIFAALEDVALDALDDGMTREALSARLQAVSSMPPAPAEGDLAARIAAQLGGSGWVSSASIWTAILQGKTRLIVQNGLPPPARMTDFYDSDAALWQTAQAEEAAP